MDVMRLFRLDGKVAVVTGGSGLYGAHISAALCEAGATVLIASRNRGQCEEKAEELRNRGYAAHAAALDLADEGSIESFMSEVTASFGGIDILVNNSVSRTGLNDIEQTTAEGWTAAQQVNGLGLMLMSKAVVAAMRERGGGNIINIASIQGILGPHFPVYGDTGMTSGVEYTLSLIHI